MASSTTQSHPVHPPQDAAEHRRKIDLRGVQIGASAGAAVTSAVGASFFGATGTITGAALGSVISSVAGAIYTRSLEGAQDRLRETTVMVRKTSAGARSDSPATVPVRQLAEVDAGTERQETGEPDEATVVVPVEPETTALSTPGTAALPVATEAATGGPGEPGEPGEPGDEEPGRAGWSRRKILTTAGIAVAGFAIALGGVSVIEAIKGGPISGGDGGTSLTRVVGGDTNTSSDTEDEPATDPEPSVTTEPSESATSEPSESEGVDATPTAEPTESATPEPTESEVAPTPTTDPTQGAGEQQDDGTSGAQQPAPTGAAAVD